MGEFVKIYTPVYFYYILAKGPGVACGKINVEKKILKNFFWIFLAYVTPRPPRSVHKKFQPNRSSRLAGYRQHIYTNVLFYYIDNLG